MEEIIIKDIDVKDSGLVIVKYNGNREATLNTKWQEQEVDYLKNDVGIGGSVKVEIVQKGKYINITKVDMASANKCKITASEKIVDTPRLMSQGDASIVAQVCLKGAVKLAVPLIGTRLNSNEDIGEYLCMAVTELTGAYKVAVKLLE